MKSASAAFLSIAILAASSNAADPLAPRPNGMAVDRPSSYMITGATIHTSPTKTLDASSNPAILIENGIIVGVHNSADTIRIKPGYQIIDLPETYHI